jgi:hypothetical protein
MSWNDHDHRGEYAEERHDHDLDYAAKHHRHYDDESTVRGLREDLGHAEARISDLEDEVGGMRYQLGQALGRVVALEEANVRLVAALRASAIDHDTVRTTGMADEAHLAISGELVEAFEAFADAIAGTLDDEPEPEPEEYDPGPEVDDAGGMSEYRYTLPEDYQRGQS